MIDLEALRATIREVVREELATLKKPITETHFSTAEAAEFARVDPKTIRRWIAAEKLTPHRAGRKLLVRRSELEKLLRGDPAAPERDLDELAEDFVRRKLG